MKNNNYCRACALARIGSIVPPLVVALVASVGLGTAQTDPAAFTRIEEVPRHGAARAIAATNAEVDDQSIIRVSFDTTKMALPSPLVPDGPPRPRVHLRVEVYAMKGSSRSPIAPVPHYVNLSSAPPGSSPGGGNAGAGSSETTAPGTIVYHEKYFDPAIGAGIPNTELSLAGTQAGAADLVEIRVTNLLTQECLAIALVPQKFGFRVKVADSLMFIKRLGVNSAAKAAGVDSFNFGPSPGVTYGGTYLARGNGFVRFLQPGTGVNVVFTKWSDPAFDVSTGQYVAGTKAGDIQTGLGAQFSLFGNVLQCTYGWNLQAAQKRQYFGIGVSFVNISTKVAGLISK